MLRKLVRSKNLFFSVQKAPSLGPAPTFDESLLQTVQERESSDAKLVSGILDDFTNQRLRLPLSSKASFLLRSTPIERAESLPTPELSKLLGVLRLAGIFDEPAIFCCASEALRRSDALSSQELASIVSSLSFPEEEKTSKFVLFFDEVEKNLRALADRADMTPFYLAKIVAGVSRAEALGRESLEAVEHRILRWAEEGVKLPSINAFADVFFENRKMFPANRFWDLYENTLKDPKGSFSFSTFLKAGNQLLKLNRNCDFLTPRVIRIINTGWKEMSCEETFQIFCFFAATLGRNRAEWFSRQGSSSFLKKSAANDLSILCRKIEACLSEFTEEQLAGIFGSSEIVFEQRSISSERFLKTISNFLQKCVEDDRMSLTGRARLFGLARGFRNEKLMHHFQQLLKKKN